MKHRAPRALARISTRLLAFNLLLVFLPVAGFFALDTYERQLLRALEHALVQQARVLASALSGRAGLDVADAERILRELALRQEARLRVVDATGRLLADSSRLAPEAVAGSAAPTQAESGQASGRALYRLASLAVRLLRRLRPPQPPLESSEFYGGSPVLDGSEIRDALAGRYGAATRISSGGQRSVTLYSAIPVWSGGAGARADRAVVGAVLASQSTWRILRDLYELRLRVARIFAASIAAAVAIGLLAATTITRPLARLQSSARLLLDAHGRIAGSFQAYRRRDEIGDLSRALQELTRRQEEHLRGVESFAADLSHEIRNPLASIRSAAEMAAAAGDGTDRARFLDMIRRDTARMERLLSDVRELSRIDAHLAEEERPRVDVGRLAADVLEVLRMRTDTNAVEVRLHATAGAVVAVSPDRLVQVLEKLLENAVSFSPAGCPIDVTVASEGGAVALRVEDRGPGVSEAMRFRIFDRFFTWRPGPSDSSSAGHSGLGLALVRAIAEGYGGTAAVRDRPGGGASFEVRLPAASA